MAPMKRVGAQGGSDVVVFGGASSGRKNSRYACFGVSEPGGFDSGVSSSDPQVANSGATEMRYRKLYEEKMNPFNEFHSREQERSYKNLRLHDKVGCPLWVFPSFIFFFSCSLLLFMAFSLVFILFSEDNTHWWTSSTLQQIWAAVCLFLHPTSPPFYFCDFVPILVTKYSCHPAGINSCYAN